MSLDEKARLLSLAVNSDQGLEASSPSPRQPSPLPPVGWKTHIRVILAFIVCFFSSGPLLAFPTIEPLLIAGGLFDQNCPPAGSVPICPSQTLKLTNLYTAAVGVSGVFIIFAGLAYDKFGARFCAVVGAIGASLGIALFFAAIQWKQVEWLAFIGLPLSDAGAILNSLAIFGFLYHYPTLQALIIGVASSSQLASSLLGTQILSNTRSCVLLLPCRLCVSELEQHRRADPVGIAFVG